MSPRLRTRREHHPTLADTFTYFVEGDRCAPIIEKMKGEILGAVAKIPDDGIRRRASLPAAVLEQVVREMFEPAFRKANAHRFLS